MSALKFDSGKKSPLVQLLTKAVSAGMLVQSSQLVGGKKSSRDWENEVRARLDCSSVEVLEPGWTQSTFH